MATLFDLGEGQRGSDSRDFVNFCRIAGLDPNAVDPMEVVRALFQPDYSFARAFTTHRDTDWAFEGEAARKKSIVLLRLLGAYWSLTKAQQVRRGLCQPGSGHDRTSRGRIFYTALREGRVLSREQIDQRLDELRQGSARAQSSDRLPVKSGSGADKSKSKSAPSRPPPSLLPPVTSTPSRGDMEDHLGPLPDTGRDLRARLSSRNAPLIPSGAGPARGRQERDRGESGRRSRSGSVQDRLGRPSASATITSAAANASSRTGSKILDNLMSSHLSDNNFSVRPPPGLLRSEEDVGASSKSNLNQKSKNNSKNKPNDLKNDSKNLKKAKKPNESNNTSSAGGAAKPTDTPNGGQGSGRSRASKGEAANHTGSRTRRWDVPPPGYPRIDQSSNSNQNNNANVPSVSTGSNGQARGNQRPPTPTAIIPPLPPPPPQAEANPPPARADPPPARANPPPARANQPPARSVHERVGAQVRDRAEEEETPQVLLFQEGRARLEGQRLTDLRTSSMHHTIRRQMEGDTLSFTRWQRHDGHITVDIAPGPGGRWTAQQSGDTLISTHNGRRVSLQDGSVVAVEAVWNTALPRVAELTARLPGSLPEDMARQLVESPVAGLARANDFSGLAASQLRFISSRPFEDGSGDTLIRFEAGAQAVREIQRVRGVITLGCVRTTVWWDGAEITPATNITLRLQR